MTRTATGFDALITGLNLSAPYPVRVVVTDVDGVSGEAVQVAKVAVSAGDLIEVVDLIGGGDGEEKVLFGVRVAVEVCGE